MSTLAFVPVKNCAAWLPVFLHQLEQLDDVGQIVFSYGGSHDYTLQYLKEYKEKSRHKVRVKPDPPMGEVLSSAQIGKIYRSLQDYMKGHPDEFPETHVALLDADVMRMPPDLFPKLKDYKKNIIAPYVWVLYHDTPCRWFYDTMVFRYKGFKFHPYNPPLNDGELLQLDSVGTAFLVEKDVFLDVPYGDPYPHMKFCDDARAKGYEVWADPSTSIYHLDLVRFGVFHHELEVLKAIKRGDRDPGRYTDPVGFIKDDDSVVSVESLGIEYRSLYTLGVLP